jgi:hypothetical protein
VADSARGRPSSSKACFSLIWLNPLLRIEVERWRSLPQLGPDSGFHGRVHAVLAKLRDKDIGFYLFSLPAYVVIKNWMLLTLFLSALFAGAVYWEVRPVG